MLSLSCSVSQHLKLNTPSAPPRQSPAEEVAFLTLDAAGRITLANAAARKLWQTGETELIGEAFPNLFSFEVTSRDKDWIEAQWEVLLSATLDQTVPLAALPREGAPRDVTVCLEKSPGDAPVYLVQVQPVAPLAATATPALPSELASLALLAEKSALGFFDLNFKDSLVYYSPGWKKILGFTENELANTYDTWLKLLHPDDSAAAPDRIAKKSAGGSRPFSLEFRMQHRRGHYLWIHSNGVQISDPAGSLERVIGVHADITERKEQEEAALIGEERLQNLSSIGQLGAFDFDFAQNRSWLSPAWKLLAGCSDETADAVEIFRNALLPAETEGGLEAFFLARHADETTGLEPGRLRHKDGRLLPVLLGVHRQISQNGELQRVTGFHLVLPAEAASATIDMPLPPALFAETLTALAEAVLVTDGRGTILYLNAKAAQLTGWPLENALSRPVEEVFQLVRHEDSAPDGDALACALTASEPLEFIAEYSSCPGRRRRSQFPSSGPRARRSAAPTPARGHRGCLPQSGRDDPHPGGAHQGQPLRVPRPPRRRHRPRLQQSADHDPRRRLTREGQPRPLEARATRRRPALRQRA